MDRKVHRNNKSYLIDSSKVKTNVIVPSDEQETQKNYDNVTKQWSVWTDVQGHVTAGLRKLEVGKIDLRIAYVDGTNRIIGLDYVERPGQAVVGTIIDEEKHQRDIERSKAMRK